MKVYVIEGNPVALKRPRYSSTTQRMYNSQRNHMLVTSISLESQKGSDPLFEGPLHIDVTFYMPYTSRVSKREITAVRNAIINTKPHAITDVLMPANSRPDLDNCIKLLLDCCSSILFKNDSSIVSINAKKFYDDNPRTEFSIRSLKKVKNEKR